MGALVSLFSHDGNKSSVDIFLDFEKAPPPADGKERELYDDAAHVLANSQTVLDKLLNYTGCEDVIRKAITTPGAETEQAAWKSLVPAINLLKEMFEYSRELERVFPLLLAVLCGGNPDESLQTQQALARLLADIFDFALRFDDSKMVNPAIQNDFSYYRRSMARMKQKGENADTLLQDDIANRMSLFFAYPTPMMKAITDSTTTFVTANAATLSREAVVNGLSLMANVCYDMVNKGRFTNAQTNMFCLRAMTGCVVLVDHISPVGAFGKKSPIFMKGCITVLKNFTDAPTDGLLNALRFTTLHLNDPETPSSIKALLA